MFSGSRCRFDFRCSLRWRRLLVLAVFWIGAIPHLDFKRYAFDVPAKGWHGSLAALPFALWLYLGIEQLPLAAEESHDPKRDMPRGILYGLVTLIVCSFLTVILSAGIAPGAAKLGASQEPLVLSFQTIAGTQWTKLFGVVACIGLVASFHTIIYAYGRQIYSLSRAGYFPTWLSVTDSKHQTPVRALVSGSALGLAAALGIYWFGQNSQVGAILLNMAVFGAVIAYILQMASFLILRWRLPLLARPYVSPWGAIGAWIATAIAAITLVSLFLNPDYAKGVWGAAVWFALGIVYFAVYARKRLVLSPEEEFAVRAGKSNL